MEIGEKLLVHTRQEWRDWLAEHGRTHREIWLVHYKKTSGKVGLSFDEALDEALCFGWIDNFSKSIDQETYVVRYSPRRTKSPWSGPNRARVARLLQEEGRMTEAGLATLPPDITSL